MTPIEQRLEQMAKHLAVASVFAEHPNQDDDYDRIMQVQKPNHLFKMEGFCICEDYAFHHPECILERLETEYDVLKSFGRRLLASLRVWKLMYDWDGGSFCDVIIGDEQTAQSALIKTINDILNSDRITMDHLPELTSAIGESEHPFWHRHHPLIYQASMEEVSYGQ